MARRQIPDRIEQLVEAAARVFIVQGYRRAQMADIAREMDVAPGTLYLYVESKEALFDLVLRHFPDVGEGAPVPDLPVPTPPSGAVLEHLRERLKQATALPTLRAACQEPRPADLRTEFAAIVRELYTLIHRYRQPVALIERSAQDWPELARLYYEEVRRDMIRQLIDYLQPRMERGILRPMPDVEVAACLILETTAWFSLHRYSDYDGAKIDHELARETVVRALTHAFVPDRAPGNY